MRRPAVLAMIFVVTLDNIPLNHSVSCSAAARCGGCRKNKTSVQRGKYPSGAQGRGVVLLENVED